MNSLNGYEIILASGSPRRKAFFNEMGLDFKNKVIDLRIKNKVILYNEK